MWIASPRVPVPSGRSKPWDELSSACLGIIERLTKELAIGLPMATDDPPPLTLGQAVPPLGGGHAGKAAPGRGVGLDAECAVGDPPCSVAPLN